MPIIAKIVNLSIETGEMPNDFKHAVITPLLKSKGFELIYKNFCPASSCVKNFGVIIDEEHTLNHHIT